MHINNGMFQNSIVVMHMFCTGIHHVWSKASSADFTSDMHAVLYTTTYAWQQLSLPCVQSCIYAKLWDFECDWCASLFRSHTVLINSKRVELPVWYTDWTIAGKYVYDRTRVTHWSPTHLVVMHTRTRQHNWITYQLLIQLWTHITWFMLIGSHTSKCTFAVKPVGSQFVLKILISFLTIW